MTQYGFSIFNFNNLMSGSIKCSHQVFRSASKVVLSGDGKNFKSFTFKQKEKILEFNKETLLLTNELKIIK